MLVGCGRAAVPDPRQAALAWATAEERGDGAALYDMLDARSRATTSRAEWIARVQRDRAELAEQGKSVRTESSAVVATARVPFVGGGEASLAYENGAFRVASAGVLPGGGSTPEEALAALRGAVERRSWASLLRVLSPSLRAQVEAQLRALVEAMPTDAHPTDVSGDVARFERDGHVVTLRREQGRWYVENFE